MLTRLVASQADVKAFVLSYVAQLLTLLISVCMVDHALAKSEYELFFYGGGRIECCHDDIGLAKGETAFGLSIGRLGNSSGRRMELRLKALNTGKHGVFGLDLVPSAVKMGPIAFLYGLGAGFITAPYRVDRKDHTEEDEEAIQSRGVEFWIPLSLDSELGPLKLRLMLDLALVENPFGLMTLGIGF